MQVFSYYSFISEFIHIQENYLNMYFHNKCSLFTLH